MSHTVYCLFKSLCLLLRELLKQCVTLNLITAKLNILICAVPVREKIIDVSHIFFTLFVSHEMHKHTQLLPHYLWVCRCRAYNFYFIQTFTIIVLVSMPRF